MKKFKFTLDELIDFNKLPAEPLYGKHLSRVCVKQNKAKTKLNAPVKTRVIEVTLK